MTEMTQMKGARVAQAKPALRNGQDHQNNESVVFLRMLSLFR
jgi:hypothetical protein